MRAEPVMAGRATAPRLPKRASGSATGAPWEATRQLAIRTAHYKKNIVNSLINYKSINYLIR